jgi:hypothetical protein
VKEESCKESVGLTGIIPERRERGPKRAAPMLFFGIGRPNKIERVGTKSI